MRRTLTILTVLLLAAAPASAQIRQAFARETARLAAQTPPAPDPEDLAWARVRAFKPGRTMMLGAGNFEMDKVKFVQADDASLTVVTSDGVTRTIVKADVREVRNPMTYYARRGMLWGLLAGSMFGISRCWAENLVGVCGMFYGGIGMGLGAAVGGAANVDAHENELIYRRSV